MSKYLLLLLFITNVIAPMDRTSHKKKRRHSKDAVTQWIPSSSSSDSDDFDTVPQTMPRERTSKAQLCLKGLVVFLAASSCAGDITALAGIAGVQRSCSP